MARNLIKDDRVLAFGFDQLRGAGTYWLTNKVPHIYLSGVGKVNAAAGSKQHGMLGRRLWRSR